MIKVLVFDFDGIILESVKVKDHAIFNLFEDISLDERKRILDLHRQTPGINRRERMALLLNKGLGIIATSDAIDRLIKRFSLLVWNGLMTCQEVPGIRNFLIDMSHQKPCYIVSAAPHVEIKSIARKRHFSNYFKDIFGTPPSKEERLQEIILRENVSSKLILFFGDKISDYKAAQNLGVNFIGRKTPNSENPFPDEIPVINDFTSELLLQFHE